MKYIVETINTFREIHLIEAENEEIAQKISEQSDYNMSKWLGQQTLTIYPYSDEHVERFLHEDEYFWDGVKSIDSEGYLTYQRPGEEPVRSNLAEKII